MRGDPYGSHRVISPKGLLPQAAERVDNSPTICSNEILIDVIALQPTATAFGRIKQECGGDVNRYSDRSHQGDWRRSGWLYRRPGGR